MKLYFPSGLIIFFVLIFLLSAREVFAIPAFPGAEGFGSQTLGGRGGNVIAVTNTNESGTGSLRAAIDSSGARIIVFRTGGYITLSSPLVVKNPFVTIAGQTAPGDGIVIRGAPLIVATHDVVIRGMRIRVGDSMSGSSSTSRDSISVSNSLSGGAEIYNVVIDHSSFSWSIDEAAAVYQKNIHDITYSWNIISEALNSSIHVDEGKSGYDPHSMGFMLSEYSENISVHNSLLAHNKFRNPFIRQGSKEFINNVVYNWGNESTIILDNNGSSSPQNMVNIIGNYYKAGPNTAADHKYGVMVSSGVTSGSKIYLKGNIGPGRESDSGDEWGLATCSGGCFKSTVPAFTSSLKTITSAQQAYDSVLQKAGALAPMRDAVDVFIVSTVKNGSGKFIDCIQTCNESTDIRNYHNGWPSYSSGSPPSDSDSDGMPDSWEQGKGGNLNPAAIAPSGYTWIEEYINSLIPSSTSAGSPSPTATAGKAGDANNDKIIDGIDYAIWLNHYGDDVATGVAAGDFNRNRTVDGVDYAIWLNNYGK